VNSHSEDGGPKFGLQPIGGALAAALRRLGLAERFQERELLDSWSDAVGRDIAAHVRAVDIEDGILVLSADHGAWRQEVNMLAAQILEKLAVKHGAGTITGLRWCDRPGVRRWKRGS